MAHQEPAIPPDVLAVFVELQRLVDSAVGQLQQQAGESKPVDQAAPGEVSTSAVTQTIYPASIPSGEAFGTPTITLQDVERARSWLAGVRAATEAAAATWDVAERLDVLEGLLSLGERVLGS